MHLLSHFNARQIFSSNFHLNKLLKSTNLDRLYLNENLCYGNASIDKITLRVMSFPSIYGLWGLFWIPNSLLASNFQVYSTDSSYKTVGAVCI